MATGKEIRKKIASVQNTQKITRAMQMVAASKMRRAQERMNGARPYAAKIRNVIGHLHSAHPEYHHPFLQVRAPRRIGLILVTSDRGLCGGLNANLLRTALAAVQQWHEQRLDVDLCTIGSKGFLFCKRVGLNVVSHVSHLGDTPRIEALIGSVRSMLDAYAAGGLDRLYLVFNRFVNTMSQKPLVEALLPLPASDDPPPASYWDYLYEPEAKDVLDDLLTRYIEAIVYRSVVENLACEQAARTVAMKSASDNAGDLIDRLKLRYNKARQAAITQEITEIVAGAAAV